MINAAMLESKFLIGVKNTFEVSFLKFIQSFFFRNTMVIHFMWLALV